MDPQLIYLLLALMAAGGAAGFSAGLFGIGGGAIIVPCLYAVFTALGYSSDVVMHTAVATSAATIIVTSIRSASGHHKHGAVDWNLIWPQKKWVMKIGGSWGLWIAIGSLFAAAVLARFLSGNMLAIIFGVMASLIAVQLIFGRPDWRLAAHVPSGTAVAPIGMSLGALCSLMGIGFGSFGVTFMVLCGKRIHSAIGTAAALGMFISIPATFGFVLSGQGVAGRPEFSFGYVNVLGFAIIATMSFLFIPFGVHTAHKLPQDKLRLAFGICLLLVALNMLRKAI